jgi:hypothetical protein
MPGGSDRAHASAYAGSSGEDLDWELGSQEVVAAKVVVWGAGCGKRRVSEGPFWAHAMQCSSNPFSGNDSFFRLRCPEIGRAYASLWGSFASSGSNRGRWASSEGKFTSCSQSHSFSTTRKHFFLAMWYTALFMSQRRCHDLVSFYFVTMCIWGFRV